MVAVKRRKARSTDKLVRAFSGGGVDLSEEQAVLDCDPVEGEQFSIVFPTTLLNRFIALGLAMSGALARETSSETFALKLEGFATEFSPTGDLLLRLVIKGRIPLTIVLDRCHLPELKEKLSTGQAEPTLNVPKSH